MIAACAFPANHGTPGAIRELGLHLVRQGHEVHVVSYPQSEDIPVDGLRIHRVHIPFEKPSKMGIGPSFKRIMYDLLLVPKLVSVVRREKLDIIHAHGYEACIAAALARLIVRKPLIYNGVMTMADELPSYGFIPSDSLARWIGSVLDYIVPRLSDFIMVLSDEMKDYLLQLGVAGKKILVVPPGVEMTWLSSGDGQRVREKLQLAPSSKIVLYTGVLETFQRIDYLLAAMAIVSQSVTDAMLIVAGNITNQEDVGHYSALAAELGIADRVKIVRHVPLEVLPDYLALADVTVVSRPNCPGYPIKLLNYVAAAKPVVCFAGSAKSLCHGYSGYVAENGNVEDLARGIKLFLEDEELGTTIGAQARASMQGVFDWTTISQGVAEVYRNLIENRHLVSKEKLAAYFKASYNPILSDVTRISDFQIGGIVNYPSLTDTG